VRILEIIAAKRDGYALTREQIDFVIDGVCHETIPDYQTSALLMAIVLRGMNADETWWLTDAMVRSGSRLDLSDIPGVKVGKHSTGGVGDKTSLVLAPIVAACGVVVPKMSGRGLGHTGGTLDKLESIAGFNVNLSIEAFRRVLRDAGTSVIAQSPDIVPADKKLYALRDVTGTVASIPLIASSIMSKKLAEGSTAIVLDVKVGRGAFMKTVEDARSLAHAMVSIGELGGVRTEVFITRMDQPLGRAVGNALEIIECFETLKGRGPADLVELVTRLSTRMVELAGVTNTVANVLKSGAALEVFRKMIVAQGGDGAVVDDYSRLPAAPKRHMVVAPTSGHLHALDAELVGRAAMVLGAGRATKADPVDHAVGAIVHARIGDKLKAGDPILELHYRSDETLRGAADLVSQAVRIGDSPVAPVGIIVEAITHSEPGASR
jgi:pyrimidine-nucleoside phosphorylase